MELVFVILLFKNHSIFLHHELIGYLDKLTGSRNFVYAKSVITDSNCISKREET